MSSKKITAEDLFMVSAGRSVLTASRGMAHAGGIITIADVDVKVMREYVKSGKVKAYEEPKEVAEARKVAAEAAAEAAATHAANKQQETGTTTAANKAAAEAPPTEEEIIEAIGKLDKDNTEMWTTGGAPQVSSLEDILGKQISAADRDAAWLKVQDAAKED